MKITLYITTLLLSFLIHSQEKPTVLVNANYHNRSCSGGVGFCSENCSIIENKDANATLEKKSENEVVLILDFKYLAINEIEQLQTEKIFTNSGSKSLSLDTNLLSRLNINLLYSEIKVGSYPIQIIESKVYITLPLSIKQN